MREVIIDVGTEIDSTFYEIDKLKLSEQRMNQNIDDMLKKVNFIRAKTETALFKSLPEHPESPMKAMGSPTISAKEMLSPKSAGIGVDNHIEVLKRV